MTGSLLISGSTFEISDLTDGTNDSAYSHSLLYDDISGDVTYGKITFDRLGDEYTQNDPSLGTTVDWSSYATYQKVLTGDTTLTDSNLRVGTKTLIISGSFTLTVPTYWNIIDGSYDGSSGQKNAIVVTCLVATGGSEEVIASIKPYTP